MADLFGEVHRHLFRIFAQPHNADLPVFIFVGLPVVVQSIQQRIGEKSVALVAVHRRLLVAGRGIDVKPHLLGQYRHTGIVEAAGNGVYASRMAGFKDEKLP